MLIYADPNWDPASYDNILNIINSTIPNDLSITQTYTADAAEMENLLQQNDILLLPFNDFTITTFFNNNPTLVSDFVANGGQVLFLNNLELASSTGLFQGFSNFGFGGSFEIVEDHPITQNVSTNPAGIDFANSISFQNDVTSLINYTCLLYTSDAADE